MYAQKDLSVALHVNRNFRKLLNTFMPIKVLLTVCEVNANLAEKRNPGDHQMNVLVRTLDDGNVSIDWNILMPYEGINIATTNPSAGAKPKKHTT
jgi:hypothetical protein